MIIILIILVWVVRDPRKGIFRQTLNHKSNHKHCTNIFHAPSQSDIREIFQNEKKKTVRNGFSKYFHHFLFSWTSESYFSFPSTSGYIRTSLSWIYGPIIMSMYVFVLIKYTFCILIMPYVLANIPQDSRSNDFPYNGEEMNKNWNKGRNGRKAH